MLNRWLSGVIGKGQQFYGPSRNALRWFTVDPNGAFLAPNNQVVTRNTGVTASPGYELSEVALFLEVVELPERAIKIFNSAVLGGVP